MIQRLYVKDFAVIDELDLAFGPGMNLLTGETGSGKSVIVDALGIALGERADLESVRGGCEKAVVEAVLFVGGSAEALAILEEAGIEAEDGQVIVTREVLKTGKSQCRINGRASTVSMLKEITDHLVDTHGQHEHQSLLKTERHINLLDAWCGEKAALLKARVESGYRELLGYERELRRLESDERERARMLDLYKYQAEEISAAKLVPGEEEELGEARNRLANAERLYSAAAAAYELLSDGDASAVDTLGRAVSELEGIAALDPGLTPLLESLQSALYAAQEGARELRSYRDDVEFNPERLESVEERLELLRNLKRKYGDSVEEILSFGSDLESRIESLENSEERTSELNRSIEKLHKEIMQLAEELSGVRRQGAESFSKKVQEELAGLNMPNAVFLVQQEPKALDAAGIDSMEFLISANQGEPPKPLAKIASGGEMSRVMLAIKSATSAADKIPALVFDEIDVGVGGRTAEVIADKLALLSKKSQVLCITHLPQIASRPGNHYCIEKQLHNGRTVVRVRSLSMEERVEEIARMLGGANTTETALRHAAEMLASGGS